MSKSKSKSKSKSISFPSASFKPDFEIYTHYPALFAEGRALFEVPVSDPPVDGDRIAEETAALLELQQRLADDVGERHRRLEEIEWEADHLARSYHTALLTDPGSYPRTWQLMNTMSDLALIPVMHFKKMFGRARPSQVEPAIQPPIDVPGHPAYPSGHATQNFLVAHALSEVIGDDAELTGRIFAIARRVAENREWAGLHYRSDTDAGEDLAREIFPIMKRALAEPIREAIAEWQEIDIPDHRTPAPVAANSSAGPPDPFPGTFFREHQWNLENTGQRDGAPDLDIRVRPAWEKLGIRPEGAEQAGPSISVALIDLAVDLDHPALVRTFDRARARNLDYPGVPRGRSDGSDPYAEAFMSFSSAHAVACAGIIGARRPVGQAAERRWCLGIAPGCRIVPYRAMTLTEPVLRKRQVLARAVLEATTGVTFEPVPQPRSQSAPRWTSGAPVEASDVLFLPLPLDPLPEGVQDPLAVALAFAARKIPVIIPSGNKGTSKLSYLAQPARHLLEPSAEDGLSKLFDLDEAAIDAVFGAGTSKTSDAALYCALIEDIKGARAICVGACNDRGVRSRYSQYGEDLTLVAPSDDVLPVRQGDVARLPPTIATTDLRCIAGYQEDDGDYTLSDNVAGFGGTSAAGAQVAGVVALMLQAKHDLGPARVREILEKTARRPHGEDYSIELGYGLVDAGAAVELAAA